MRKLASSVAFVLFWVLTMVSPTQAEAGFFSTFCARLLGSEAEPKSAETPQDLQTEILSQGLSNLFDPNRGWALIDVSPFYELREAVKIYESLPNNVLPDSDNRPLPPSLLQLTQQTLQYLNEHIGGEEAGRLVVERTVLRRSDGRQKIGPLQKHLDSPHLTINITLLGEGTTLYSRQADMKISTKVGTAAVIAGLQRPLSLGVAGLTAGLHAAPDTESPRLTLALILRLKK